MGSAERGPGASGAPTARIDANGATLVLTRHGNYAVEPVSFTSSRLQLAGTLYVPAGLERRAPAIVILGPLGQVKEQSPVQYATRLADEGFLVLAFDCAHHGESAGEPRQLIDPARKVADLRAAVGTVASLSMADQSAIVVVGIGEGGAEAIAAAASDPRISAVVTVAGRYRDPDSDLVALCGEDADLPASEGARRLRARLERARAASARYATTGEVDYAPLVDPARDDVALPGEAAWRWFNRNAGLGRWENRYAVMGDLSYFAFESLGAAASLSVPLLMVHGQMDAPDAAAARRHFECVASPKQLVWLEEPSRLRYYDDPVVVDQVAAQITRWLARR